LQRTWRKAAFTFALVRVQVPVQVKLIREECSQSFAEAQTLAIQSPIGENYEIP